MDVGDDETKLPAKLNDRTTSDVIVRLRTKEGRDNLFYCHSYILVEKSKYFADRLSKDWLTCQILDSRHCVEVNCRETEFNSFVSAIRLFYAASLNICHGVRNALGILQVSVHLGYHELADACADYIEAVPWDETEEKEILEIIPALGPKYASILSRLKPVEPTTVMDMFVSTIRFASSPLPSMVKIKLKFSAQDQLEYMLTDDDDLPPLNGNETFKSEARRCIMGLMCRFTDSMESISASLSNETFDVEKQFQTIESLVVDISWGFRILCKLEMMKDFVIVWVSASTDVAKVVEFLSGNVGKVDASETILKVVEVAAKVLETISHGNVILPTSNRIFMVKVWLPFMQKARFTLENTDSNVGDLEDGFWQNLEAAFVSIILGLPSEDQAAILAEWFRSDHVHYPDLTEAFELWCYRTKNARRRLAFLGESCDKDSN